MKIQHGKRNNKNFVRDQDLLVEVEDYLLKTEEYFEEEEDTWNISGTVNESNQSAMLLEFIS